jgi:hypothetical protein
MRTSQSRRYDVLLFALSFISTIALADTYYWCQNEQTCGTEQSPTLANGCLGITCPVSQVCQGEESTTGNSCDMSAYMAQCSYYMYDSDPVTETCIPGTGHYVSPAPGGTACEQCTIS